MFYRVYMDVIQMHPEIPGVADCVLPEPRLPNAPPAMTLLARRYGGLASAGGKEGSRESFFDGRQTRGEITVAFGKPPDCVKMVRQQNEALHQPRMRFLRLRDGIP